VNKPPRSKLAIAFYVAGTIMVLAVGYPALLLSLVGASGGGRAMSGFGAMGLAMLIQPITALLFGGVVQMVSDIRWALLRSLGDQDA
jgi:hypothetical protein